ncbi:probable carbohydrate esterase At4g34215 [Setaria italica]|uniref:probable carbohydrate esterase At4g34215 n=1 Tax=Setaria italica TaxID=4555 RepID=UPI000BE55584|nr:probable carbohydrate esterase At4g34215 [Setaria italica]
MEFLRSTRFRRASRRRLLCISRRRQRSSSVSVGSELGRSSGSGAAGDGSASSPSREETEQTEAMEEDRARRWRLASVPKRPPRESPRLSSTSSDSPPAAPPAAASSACGRAPSPPPRTPPPPNAPRKSLDAIPLLIRPHREHRGGVVANRWDGVVPSDCAPSPAVLRLSPDLRWEQAREPLHQGIDASNNHAVGVGPGMPFANALLRSGRAGAPVVALVPCAVGGTRMADWARGTDLYAQMLRRARVALETGGRIGALLWYQGESDTVRWSDANEYGRRMGMFVRDIHADLGIPHLLVIQVGLASGLGHYTQLVREVAPRQTTKFNRQRAFESILSAVNDR